MGVTTPVRVPMVMVMPSMIVLFHLPHPTTVAGTSASASAMGKARVPMTRHSLG
jgi:hypothetical protein